WQWQANVQLAWATLSVRPGWLRLSCQPTSEPASLWSAGHLLLQKFPAPEFQVTTRLEFFPQRTGDAAGLVIFGKDYASIGLRLESNGLQLCVARCLAAHKSGHEVVTERR